MATMMNAQPGIKYLDMQAYVGLTKHIGGCDATDELLALCQIDQACEGSTIFLTTHNMAEAEELCPGAAVIR